MRIPVLIAAMLLATPTHAAELRVWSLDIGGGTAFLTYAIPESDDLGIALSCETGSRTVTLSASFGQRLAARLEGERWVDAAGRPAPWAVPVTVISGPLTRTLPGEGQADDLNDGTAVSVEVAVDAPVMAAFAASGRIALGALGQTVNNPPARPEMARRFVSACS